MSTIALADFNSFLVGFDRVHNSFVKCYNHVEYPRFNLLKVSDDEYKVEVALAGWTKKDIEIIHSKTDTKLTIKGKKQFSEKDSSYLHKGISGKSFHRDFVLAEHVMVATAELTAGLLTVTLRVEVPEEKKPTKINII